MKVRYYVHSKELLNWYHISEVEENDNGCLQMQVIMSYKLPLAGRLEFDSIHINIKA